MDTAKTIIDKLYERGWNASSIARETGSTQPTIWRIRNGKVYECKSELYRALFGLLQRKPRKKAA